MNEFKFNVYEGTTSNSLITVIHATSWQSARVKLQKEGYKGKYLLEQLEQKALYGFKMIQLNIK